MPRRRPPSMRRTNSTSAVSSSSSSSKRNADTRNLVTATNVFGGQEVGGVVRSVLLGALVGGMVIFLFYPDISGFLERWHNSSEVTRILWNGVPEREGSGARNEDVKLGSVNSNKQQNNRNSQKNAKRNVKPTTETPRKSSNSKNNEKTKENREEPAPSSCPCTCRVEPVTPPPRCQPPPPPPPPKKPKAKKKQKPPMPKEDPMEEEEEIVEEDPVEVQLMEEEEPEEYIDLEPEDDSSAASSTASNSEHRETSQNMPGLHDDVVESPQDEYENPASSKQGSRPEESHDDGYEAEYLEDDIQSSAGKEEEPLVLTDGQPITFTPVNSGDDNFIRVGGRPKPDSDLSSNAQAQAHTSPRKQNSSAKSNDSKAKTGGKANKKKEPKKKENAQSPKEARSSTKKASRGTPAKDTDTSSDQDLPEEVKNFQPSFLKTLTAKKIFADGRRLPPVELLPQKETNSSVKVFLFNEFLSEAECDGLRRVHDKHVQDLSADPLLCFDSISTLRKHLRDVKRSKVHVTPNDFVAGTKCLNASFSRQLGGWLRGNWSYSTAFYPGESRFSSVFASRVHQAMGLTPANGGKFQITSYPTGKAYKAHTDCVLGGTDPRDRVASVLVYLDDVEDGGETKFPELGIWVKPRKGRALVWNNMSPDALCEPHSLHVASRVNAGSKYILIRWYYYKSFYSLGKRPPEPPLPPRPEGTPRVSCDDYDNGSCRWYDEWNNDHLLDYENNKYTLI